MNMNTNMENGDNGSRIAMGLVVFLARSLAASVEVFLHKPSTFGSRYFGLQAFAAIFIILFWPAFCEPTHDPRPVFVFLAAYVVMSVAARAFSAARQSRGGPQPHTRYSGAPRWRITHRISEVQVKCFVEPVLVFLIGALLTRFTPPLGGYLIVAAIGQFSSNVLADVNVRRRALDMHDAYMDQRDVVERFRDMQQD